MEKTYEGIINLALTLVNSMKEEKEQEQKHLKNARCKKPNFSNCNYALGRLRKGKVWNRQLMKKWKNW